MTVEIYLVFRVKFFNLEYKMMLAQKSGLSNIQKELLKLYASDIPEETLLEIKAMLSQYFAEKATNAMDRFLDEHNISSDDMENWSHEHNRYDGGN